MSRPPVSNGQERSEEALNLTDERNNNNIFDLRLSQPIMSMLMPSLPLPPPHAISSAIMLDQLNSSSEIEQQRREVTYRRLESNSSLSPTMGSDKTVSPVSSPGISTSPSLPIEAVQISRSILSYPESQSACQAANNVIEQGEDPLTKLQNALENGFLGRKLFNPMGDVRPRENQPAVAASNDHFVSQLVAVDDPVQASPDSNNQNQVEQPNYRCHLCNYQSISKNDFNAHVNTHFDHKCPFCDYTSRTDGRLKRHVKDFHCEIPPESWAGTRVYRGTEDGASGGESNGSNPNSQSKVRNFKCKQCDHVAKSKTEFWQHSKEHIKSEKLLSCPKCQFVTEYKHHLEYHLRNHFGSKPFKCSKCNYSCVNKSMLNSHMKSHSNVYQYRCKDCAYATKYCHSLKMHLRKYAHQPATVLNLDGTPNPYPVIDVYGTRRGPRPKRNKEEKSKPTPKKNQISANMAVVSSTISPSSQGGDTRGVAVSTAGSSFPQLPPQPLMVTSNTHWMYQSHLMASIHAGMFAARPTLLTQDQMRHEVGHHFCPFCDFTTDNHELLSKHIFNHASGENGLINVYGAGAVFQPEACHEEASNHSEDISTNHEHHKDTPPPSEEMDCSLSSPPCPVSSRAGSPDDLTEEYNQDDEHQSSRSFNDDDQMVVYIADKKTIQMNEQINLDSLASSVAKPILLTPPKNVSNEMAGYPLDLSHPRDAKTPVGSQSSSSRNRRKGKAFKLSRISSVQVHDAPEDGDDESENYPPPIKMPKGGEKNENHADTSTSSRISSPFKEINKSLSGSFKLPETLDSMENEAQAYRLSIQALQRKDPAPLPVVSNHSIVEKQSPTSSSCDVRKTEAVDPSWKTESWKCNFCEISFGDCVMYTVHMGYHGYQDPFKCNMCGLESKDKVEFFLHIARYPHLFG